MAGKRKCLSFKEKIEIIEESEKYGLSTRQLAKKFKVGKTQVTLLLQNKAEVRSLFQQCGNGEIKRKFRKTEGLAVDQAVYNWFCKARSQHLPISGPILQKKALETAQCLGLDKFKASNGWLERFRQRHNITFKKLYEETTEETTIEYISSWEEKLLTILKDYAPRDVFNADETGIYYRLLPKKTYYAALQGDTSNAKQHFTILFCANMDGEKEEPLIVGESKIPRCLEGEHMDKLPVQWISNKKAWITTEIMTSWLHRFDSKMKKENRKIVLFLDNATSHPKVTLDNVQVIFLPFNNTSGRQPLEQGVIQYFKMLYRSYLVKRLLTCIDSGCHLQEIENNISINDALIWISEAWRNLSPLTIKKCFMKAGFMCNIDISEFFESAFFEEEDDNIPLALLFPNIKDTFLDLRQFASIDSDLQTESKELSIIECIDEIQKTNENTAKCEVEDEKPEILPVSNITSLSQACASLRDLENFFYNINNFDISKSISQVLLKCESEFYRNKLGNV